MNKIHFKYQRRFLRLLCLLVTCFLLIFLEYFFVKLTKIPYENFWFDLVVIFSWIFTTYFFDKFTKNFKLFICNGFYWIEDGIVVIEIKNKKYILKNIKKILYKKVSYMGYLESGMLKIDLNHKQLTLMSLSTDENNTFFDTDLYKLFEVILQHNTNLEKRVASLKRSEVTLF